MPYTGPNDPELPENVQELSENRRAQWVEVFNSAYERCTGGEVDDVDDCEAFAFANANGVVFEGEDKAVVVRDPEHNALKAVSKTDDELRVANYIVLFGGRDLTGAPSNGFGFATGEKNADGSRGEFFSKATRLDSPYTDTGHLLIDWEHGQGKMVDGKSAPGRDDIFGVVDWKTLEIDENGAWVERALNRRAKYMQWMETLIDAGVIGSSSEAIGTGVEVKANGEIVKWPLKRDTFTMTPFEPRMLTENVIQAAKALGLQIDEPDTPEPEAQPEADATEQRLAVEAAKARLAIEKTLSYVSQEKNT